MSQLEETLTQLFAQHRVIFWYDEKEELRERFDALNLTGIEKVVVHRNQFYLKYQITRQDPAGKYLLYFTGPKPSYQDNWMLDLELAHYEFHTDQAATFLQELGLPYDFKGLVNEHIEFFKNQERRQKLRELLGDGDSFRDIRYKMLAILFGTTRTSLVAFIQAHATAFLAQNEKPDRDLQRFHLHSFYWKLIGEQYHYTNEQPSIYDFLLEVFANVFSLSPKANLSKDAGVLLSLWKDTISYQDTYQQLSKRISQDLAVPSLLNRTIGENVLSDDLFQDIDFKIIRDLVELIVNDDISHQAASRIIKKRENKYWYADFRDYYACLSHAVDLIAFIREYKDVKIASVEDGAQRYSEQLFRVDYHYRKFIWHYRTLNRESALETLYQKVEKVYSNDWLLPFNNRWQEVIDALESWPRPLKVAQTRFFQDHVRPVIDKNQRLFVIISDALRFECGYEFMQAVSAENRYEGELQYMLTGLPSYTQLGMASLLPHQELSITDNSDSIAADDLSTQGLQGRNKILSNYPDKRAVAINAEEFLKMNSNTEGRAFVKDYDLIYIFHNQIDKTGDDTASEDKVFEAVDRELEYLMNLIKKVANVNGYNMIITADHGFIYQDQPLAESDFAKAIVEGEVWKANRRFFIGKDLEGDNNVKHFKSADLHLAGDFDVLIAKSINRHRVKGAGSRYVHGGATLQEVVVPLLKVTKKRQDTIKQVEIDIIQRGSKITTNIFTVSFLQTELATEAVLPRTIKAAIYAKDGELLSNQFTYTFDISEGSERLREAKHQFQLSSKASGKYKNSGATLILEEPVEGSSQWKRYKEYNYDLSISLENDFDNF